jgi:hypothetical protein
VCGREVGHHMHALFGAHLKIFGMLWCACGPSVEDPCMPSEALFRRVLAHDGRQVLRTTHVVRPAPALVPHHAGATQTSLYLVTSPFPLHFLPRPLPTLQWWRICLAVYSSPHA